MSDNRGKGCRRRPRTGRARRESRSWTYATFWTPCRRDGRLGRPLSSTVFAQAERTNLLGSRVQRKLRKALATIGRPQTSFRPQQSPQLGRRKWCSRSYCHLRIGYIVQVQQAHAHLLGLAQKAVIFDTLLLGLPDAVFVTAGLGAVVAGGAFEAAGRVEADVEAADDDAVVEAGEGTGAAA